MRAQLASKNPSMNLRRIITKLAVRVFGRGSSLLISDLLYVALLFIKEVRPASWLGRVRQILLIGLLRPPSSSSRAAGHAFRL